MQKYIKTKWKHILQIINVKMFHTFTLTRIQRNEFFYNLLNINFFLQGAKHLNV